MKGSVRSLDVPRRPIVLVAAWLSALAPVILLVLSAMPATAEETLDLSVSPTDIAFSRMDPIQEERFAAYALVRNEGNLAGAANVQFSVGGGLAGRVNVTVAPGGSAVASVSLNLAAGTHDASVEILDVVPQDANPANNVAETTVEVFGSQALVRFSSPVLVLNGSSVTIQGGTARTVPLDVTALGGAARNVTLRVFDPAGVSARAAGVLPDVEPGDTVRIYLRIAVPDLRRTDGPVERTLLVQAVGANARGNVAQVTVSIHPSVAATGWWTPASLAATVVGILGFLLAAVNALELGRWKFLGLILPLYSRLNKESVLDQYTRGKIHGYLLANPGDYFTSIGKALGISSGNLAYHLRVLEREGHVVSRMDGLRKRFFPRGVDVEATQGTELTPMQRGICNVIQETPGIQQKDIAALLKVTSSTTSYHLQKLVDSGVVKARRRGMSVRYYIAPKTEEEVRPVKGPSVESSG